MIYKHLSIERIDGRRFENHTDNTVVINTFFYTHLTSIGNIILLFTIERALKSPVPLGQKTAIQRNVDRCQVVQANRNRFFIVHIG